ncbi:TraR/DksA C4-type zinc finger protein [Shewanella sp.]|uniref:TraR/DksA C4-type zinc finger protein n=1 Tax=Shewanella sp. TaxID=50422 RepID=UPI003A976AF1
MDDADRVVRLQEQQEQQRLQHRQQRPAAPSRSHCAECGDQIPAPRRQAIQGVQLCISCQEWSERHASK